MANPMEFILKLTDMLTPGMRAAASASDSAATRIASDMNRVNGASKMMAHSVSDLRRQLEQINTVRFGTRIKREFDDATRQARQLERQIERLEGRGQRSGGGGIMGLLAGVGAYGAIRGTLGAAAEREQQRISFGVMTGSQATGDAMLNDIVKMGAATPFENGDLIRAAQTMKQFGIENKNVLPNLQMLGDVAGGNAEKLQSLSLAYSQVQSAGRLQGQDLLQLINAGFNPLLTISQQTGESMASLKKKMEQGAISADMVTKAFQVATGPGGQFYQMMEKQSQTLAGRWSTFMDGAKNKLLALGNAVMPVANVVLSFLSTLIDNTPALIMFGSAIGLIAVATGGWSAAQGILNFVMNMNPIVRIISLILILGGIIWTLIKQYDGWGRSMQGLWQVVKGFVKLTALGFKEMGESIWFWIQFAWLKTKSFVEYVGGAMQNVFNALKLASEFKFGDARKALTAELTSNTNKEIDALEKNYSASRAGNNAAKAAAIQQMVNGVGMVGLTRNTKTAAGTNPLKAVAGGSLPGAGAAGGSMGEGAAGGSKAGGINSGGQRSIVINIGKQIEKLEVHVMDAKEGVTEIEGMVREALRRTLMSVNGIAS